MYIYIYTYRTFFLLMSTSLPCEPPTCSGPEKKSSPRHHSIDAVAAHRATAGVEAQLLGPRAHGDLQGLIEVMQKSLINGIINAIINGIIYCIIYNMV